MSHCKILTYPGLEALLDTDEVSGKFVQLRWRGVEYLLFAPRSLHRFHNQIVAHFLEQEGLAFRWNSNDILQIDVDDLKVVGGGRFRLQPPQQLLELSDNSTAYGRFDETGIETKIRAASPLLHPYNVHVSD